VKRIYSIITAVFICSNAICQNFNSKLYNGVCEGLLTDLLKRTQSVVFQSIDDEINLAKAGYRDATIAELIIKTTEPQVYEVTKTLKKIQNFIIRPNNQHSLKLKRIIMALTLIKQVSHPYQKGTRTIQFILRDGRHLKTQELYSYVKLFMSNVPNKNQPPLTNNLMKRIFKDVDILTLNNHRGTFGEIIDLQSFIKEEGIFTNVIASKYKEDYFCPVQTPIGEEIAMITKYMDLQYVKKKQSVQELFFPVNKGEVNFASCTKSYFGLSNDFQQLGNIYKIRTTYSTAKTDEHPSIFLDRIKDNQIKELEEHGFKAANMQEIADKFGFPAKEYSKKLNGPYYQSSVTYDILENKFFGGKQFINGSLKDALLLMTTGKTEYDSGPQKYDLFLLELTIIPLHGNSGWSQLIKNYTVKGKNIRDVNTKELSEMVNVFIDDCEEHGIEVNQDQETKAVFHPLPDNVIAQAMAKNDDQKVFIAVDPDEWLKSGISKKWYTIYHELGHDILNLDHGNGGSMMFNYAPNDYTWREFLSDKEEMFYFFKKNKAK
jgi:hypothetical protein